MKERLKYFDGLKGMLCIVIMIYHYGIIFQCTPIRLLGSVYSYGHLGTYVFFAISGYLTAYQYKEKLIYSNDIDFKQYFIKKLYILPLVFVSICIPFITYASERNVYFFLFNIFCTWCGFTGDYVVPYNPVSWYICILLLCYALFYLIVYLHKRLDIPYRYLCILMCVIGLVIMIRKYDIPFLQYDNGRGYLPFFIGTMVYDINGMRFNKKNVFLICCIGLFLLLCLMLKCGGMECLGNIDVCFIILVIPLVFGLLLGEKVQLLLSCKPMTFLGRMSVSLYLSHYPTLVIMKLFGEKISASFSNAYIFIGIIMITFLNAVIWYYAFEKGFTKLVVNGFRKILKVD